MRAEIRALVIKSRSICAIRRPNSEVDGVKPSEAVLDMVIPQVWRRGAVIVWRLIYVYQMPANRVLFAWQRR